MKKLMLILAIAASSLPLGVLKAQSCTPRPMPSPTSGVGWTSENWPQGESIRFSAGPALERYAYVVQISRASPSGEANVHLTKVVREWSCNRWDLEQEWAFPLGASDANLFFEKVGEIEARWEPVQEFVIDGTGFQYEHRRAGVTRQLKLSATATGESGRLSGLILHLMSIARGQIPESPDWYE